jgi:hypothetical protein
VRQKGRPADERETIEAKLANVHQCESALEVGRATVIDHVERQLPTIARASQNVATGAALFDTLPTPSTDGVGEVYQWLKNIIGTAAA